MQKEQHKAEDRKPIEAKPDQHEATPARIGDSEDERRPDQHPQYDAFLRLIRR